MKISVNWLSDYLDVTALRADPKGVLGKLTMRGLEVESISDLGKGFEKVVVARIESRDRHPNADRLSVCRVNDGKTTLQIVCGAKNMKAGDKVALAQVGSLLPNGAKIEKGKIRDVESFGMLCSESELGLAAESEGILLLPSDASVGSPVAPLVGRDDLVFEVNVTPNRGDALSHIGVARELAAILGLAVKYPEGKPREAGGGVAGKVEVQLQNPPEAPDLCLQYHARCIEGVKVGPSPEWLARRLKAVGLRPINNVVDVTNFVLMEWGQPLHAFDFSRVKGARILVRRARAGERIPLLDGAEIQLAPEDLVIADAERPVALAGVMGGANSEVTEATKDVLLEAAQFLPATVRVSAKRHQKHSDSSHRFERQVDARVVTVAMDRAAALIAELSGGKVLRGAASGYSANGKLRATGEPRRVQVSLAGTNRFLGTKLSGDDVRNCLASIGFGVEENKETLTVTVPSYRPDVQLAEDVSEEILRVWGYDKVEERAPRMDFLPDREDLVWERARTLERLKTVIAAQGFSECVGFAFTSQEAVGRLGGPQAGLAVPLANPLNEDLAVLKTSLVGGLLDALRLAARHQQRDIRLFEARPVFARDEGAETGVREEWRLAGVMCGRGFRQGLLARDQGVDFFDAKGIVETALDALGSRGFRLQPFEQGKADSRLHPAQCAQIALGRGPCGFVGRLHPALETELKLRQPVFLFELSLDRAMEVAKGDRKYAPLARFPKVERDLSLLVPRGLPAEKVVQAAQKAGKPLVEAVFIVDTYAGEKIPAGQASLSISMVLGNPDRTLEDKEVDSAIQAILGALDRDLGVKLRLL